MIGVREPGLLQCLESFVEATQVVEADGAVVKAIREHPGGGDLPGARLAGDPFVDSGEGGPHLAKISEPALRVLRQGLQHNLVEFLREVPENRTRPRRGCVAVKTPQ